MSEKLMSIRQLHMTSASRLADIRDLIHGNRLEEAMDPKKLLVWYPAMVEIFERLYGQAEERADVAGKESRLVTYNLFALEKRICELEGRTFRGRVARLRLWLAERIVMGRTPKPPKPSFHR